VHLKVFIFASRDTPEVLDQAEKLQGALAGVKAPSVSSCLLDKLTPALDQLRMFARHRVVQTPTVLVLRGDEEVLRVLSVPEPEEFLSILQTLT
jgi:hypothetical protein